MLISLIPSGDIPVFPPLDLRWSRTRGGIQICVKYLQIFVCDAKVVENKEGGIQKGGRYTDIP